MTGATPSTAAAPLKPEDFSRLDGWLAAALSATSARVTGASRLAGGAVQENWLIDVAADGGTHPGRQTFVIRTDAAARLPVSLDRAAEFAVLKVAHRAGIRCAEPIAACADRTLIGRPFLLQLRLPGIAQGRRIVRDPGLATFGPDLARALGEELARIHAIRTTEPELAFLPIPLLPPARAEVARLRKLLDGASEPRPAMEYVLVWLDANAPPAPAVLSLVHGDYRTGNYLVDDGRLSGILDWEFAHWGDPREDLGWFCARCWRFGGDLPAGGIATRDDLLAGYNRVAERRIEVAELAYWEILAAARWGLIAVLQGDRFRRGGEMALEPALTGLMAGEMELDALDGIAHLRRQAAAKGAR